MTQTTDPPQIIIAGQPLEDDRLYTPREVAALYRVCVKTASRWVEAGLFGHDGRSVVKTPGGRHRIRGEAIRRALATTHKETPSRYAPKPDLAEEL